MSKPICIDLFCGLGGWSEAFIAEGYDCRGYDIEAHEYWVPDNTAADDGSKGTKPVEKRGWTQGCAVSLGMEGATKQPCTKLLKYPGTLILRDVRSIHGSEFKDAAVIVASPPCQAYSYRAMPWKRAKALPPPDNTLFNACFRIQREACEAAGHYIPLIVENVRGAQKWVGRARWNYGSFYLWGDVPALMPHTFKGIKTPGRSMSKDAPLKWGTHNMGPGSQIMAELQSVAVEDHAKGMGIGSVSWQQGKGQRNPNDPRNFYSTSPKRKAASAMIAKIPFPLAQHIARTFKP